MDFDQFLHCIFTTAMEGGVADWAWVSEYRWSIDGLGQSDDVQGYRAVVSHFVVDRNGTNVGQVGGGNGPPGLRLGLRRR
jgi:hypothetical protein